MIDIPEYGNIAYGKHESAHPELWPVHAWVPSVQKGGNVVQDFCGQAHATMNGTWDWNPDLPGIRTPQNNTTYNYGVVSGDGATVNDVNGNASTTDFVIYYNTPEPNASYTFLLGKSWTSNCVRLRHSYGPYWSIVLAHSYGVDTMYQVATDEFPADPVGATFRGLFYFRVIHEVGRPLILWRNGRRYVSSTTITQAKNYSQTKYLFGLPGMYDMATHGTVLSLALHNRIIDEPLTDPFSWLRKHKRKYYRATTTSGPNIAAAVYYYQRMIAG